MSTGLSARRTGSTLWLELHNPPVNFLTADLCAELHRAFVSAEDDPGVRSIVLTGKRPGCYIFHFSIPELQAIAGDNRRLGLHRLICSRAGRWLVEAGAGLALHLMNRSRRVEALLLAATLKLRSYSGTPYLWLQMMAAYQAIERSSKVTIAAINGTCNGGGTEMAACFDFRFMVGDAGYTIGQPEVLVGIVAGGGGTQRWSRLIGTERALQFLLGCEQWSPQQARAMGVISEHFPAAEFEAQVQAFAAQFGQRSARAVQQTKDAIRRGQQHSLERGLGIEMAASLTCANESSTQQVLASYAAILQREVLERDPPAEIAQVMQTVLSEAVTQPFATDGGVRAPCATLQQVVGDRTGAGGEE